jgi:sterigmatocystin biosynthesis cytochrome P450 monooxygenase
MPPYSLLTGHLAALGKARKGLPPDAVTHLAFYSLSSSIKQSNFYVDLWPFNMRPMLVVTSPASSIQLMSRNHLVKPHMVSETLESISNGPNLVTMPERMWKKWRPIFNPGFSQASILHQVPKMIPEFEYFCQKLHMHAQAGDIVQLDELTIRLTLEIIGIVSL